MSPSESSRPGRLLRLLRRLPGGRRAARRLEKLEQRLREALGQQDEVPALPAPTPATPPAPAQPGDLMRALLTRSEEQSRAEAETAFFHEVLRGLVPDQARILAALSGGAAYPLIHVMAGSRLGFGMHPVLECVSNVGRSAGVQCLDLTPVYVQGLRAWGLVEIEMVESPDALKYELLETETAVRQTLERLKQNGQGGRIVRRTLKMSALGERLWTHCRFDDE